MFVRAMAIAALLIGACVGDGDRVCSEGQVQNAQGYCVCAPGTVSGPRGTCVAGGSSDGGAAAPPMVGKRCAAHAECAGTSATYCETMFLNQCLVEGCKTADPTTCGAGTICCDAAALGVQKTLCVPLDKCP